MERVKQLLYSEFGEKYSFLKPLEVVYDISKNMCTFTFLFPENQFDFTDDNKKEITEFFAKKLELNATVKAKFLKSYLDIPILKERLVECLKLEHKSIYSVVDFKKIEIKKNELIILILIPIASTVLENINSEVIQNQIIDYMTNNFCAIFDCKIILGKDIDSQKILEEQEKEYQDITLSMQPIPRFPVFDVVKLAGKEITPRPEFLSSIKNPKTSVILAGKISEFMKRSYKRTKKEKEVEKFYYKFVLKDGNSWLNMVYFCPKAYTKKMDKLANDDTVLVVADIKKDGKYLSGYIKSLSLCQINEDIKSECKGKINRYVSVMPKKYNVMSQANIFESKIEYNETITNNDFVVFDVETTGLETDTCEIIEIGAVKVVNGEICEKFQTLVKPKSVISKLITDITGITNEMVKDAPPIENVIKDFYLFAKNSILAGYNVNFDIRFIQNAGKLVDIRFFNEVVDVLPLARQKIRCKNYKLSTVVETLALSLDNAHRAFFDALATAEVLLALSHKE